MTFKSNTYFICIPYVAVEIVIAKLAENRVQTAENMAVVANTDGKRDIEPDVRCTRPVLICDCHFCTREVPDISSHEDNERSRQRRKYGRLSANMAKAPLGKRPKYKFIHYYYSRFINPKY